MNIKFLKKVTFLLLLFSSFLINAQNGSSCTNSINVNIIDTSILQNDFVSGTEFWYSFTANSSNISITSLNKNVVNMELFSGSCSNLVSINTSSLQDTVNITETDLTVGNIYYCKLLATDSILILFEIKSTDPIAIFECNTNCYQNINLVDNGSFENGSYSSFGIWQPTNNINSDYWYPFTPSQLPINSGGQYISTSAGQPINGVNTNGNWQGSPSHLNLFLLTDLNMFRPIIWEQNITVLPNKSYKLMLDGKTVGTFQQSPRIKIYINNVLQPLSYTRGGVPFNEFFVEFPNYTNWQNIWQTVCLEWNSGSSTSADIRIETEGHPDLQNGNIVYLIYEMGNDLGLDNIRFFEYDDLDVTETHNATCNNNCIGSVDLIVNGISPFNYAWQGPNNYSNNIEDISNLCEGPYFVTVTDNAGCTGALNVYIQETKISLITNIDDISCVGDNDGVITVIPSGGVPPYTYLWSNGATTQSISNLITGTYTVTVTDANGCTQTETSNISTGSEYPQISITEITEANCDFGTISGTVTPAIDYDYIVYDENGDIVTAMHGSDSFYFGGLSEGTYTIVVENQAGCSTTENIIIEAACGCESNVIQDGNIPGLTMITQNTTWHNVNYAFNCNVTMGANVTLDIENSTISFTEGHHLMIKQGHLVAENTIFNDYCGESWGGIIIQGNNPGTIDFVNDVTLQNARYGIDIKVVVGSVSNFSINTNNSYFINNYVDIIDYWQYINFQDDYTNKVNFVNTEFVTTGFLNINYGNLHYDYPRAHVEIINSKGINFENCTFESQFPITTGGFDPNHPLVMFPLNNRGIGILSRNASFTVVGSNFNKLQYGIKSQGSPSTIKITGNNIFNNNYRGVLLENATNAEITDNHFIVWFFQNTLVPGGVNPQNSPNSYPYGLYLNASQDCVFEDNYFESSASANGGSYIGAYVKASPTDKIYRNTFTNFDNASTNAYGKSSALIVVGNNGGLQISCNDFGVKTDPANPENEIALPANKYDIALISATIGSQQGSSNQLDVTAPANNRFGQHHYTGVNIWGDKAIYKTSNSTNFTYYVYKAVTTTDINYNHTMLGISRFNSQSLPNFNKDNSCPLSVNMAPIVKIVPQGLESTSASTINGLSEFSNVINDFAQEETTKKQELETKTDNGNTNLLLSKVQNLTQSTYSDVSNEIAQTNGYVSNKVISEFMKKDLSQPITKTIALRETSPLPNEAKQEIENTELNEGLQNYLEHFQNGESPREKLEKEINLIESRKNRLISYAVKDVLLNDTTSEYATALIQNLRNRNSLYAQEQVLKLHNFMSNYNEALTTIGTIRSLASNLEAEKAENINNWLDLEEIAISIELADSTEKDSIVLANVNFLTNLAEDNNQKGQIKAQLMLEKAGIAEFDEYTPLPEEDMENKRTVIEKTISSINSSTDLIFIYPNPVKDVLTVEYALLTEASVNSLGIYDVKGKLLFSVPIKDQLGIEKIDVSSLSKGNYFVSFGINGINNLSKKFVVQ